MFLSAIATFGQIVFKNSKLFVPDKIWYVDRFGCVKFNGDNHFQKGNRFKKGTPFLVKFHLKYKICLFKFKFLEKSISNIVNLILIFMMKFPFWANLV